MIYPHYRVGVETKNYYYFLPMSFDDSWCEGLSTPKLFFICSGINSYSDVDIDILPFDSTPTNFL
jgi:hypothetical protein